MKKDAFFPFFLAVFGIVFAGDVAAEKTAPQIHAIAMHGAPKYGPDFHHFNYADPNAPKGGEVRLASIGTYDNFNPYVLKGVAAAGLGEVFETLTVASSDEAFSRYGLLAKSMEVPEDRSWVAFTLNEKARWHDGKPVTPEDVIFSLNILKTKGHPYFRSYFSGVKAVEKTGPGRVLFTFNDVGNRELPLIAGELPILPKHYWKDREFAKTTLEPPLGSGPYKIATFEPGRSVTYERNPNYWGADLATRRGLGNFDTIRYDYYRDTTVVLEAFKAGDYDFRAENVSKFWATAYDTKAVKDGLIIKEEISNERPTGMQAFVFNTRRDVFKDSRVRQALGHAFDFRWTNKNLFYGQYVRTSSYFSNSELASRALPDAAELEILEPLRAGIPKEVFTKAYNPPDSPKPGDMRRNLRAGLALLKEAGWEVKKGMMVNGQTGAPLAFEILLSDPTWERIALPFVRNLKKLGVQAKVRTVDAAQYQKRTEEFDFDMIVDVFGQSLSPGNEQRDFWGSQAADIPGSRNTIGLKNKAIDELVDDIVLSPDRESLISRTRALDRILLWNHFVIPHWHIRVYRVAYWDKFSRPPITPKYDLCFSCWWVDKAKLSALETRQGGKTNE
jgi:microcin C transport system substrate-binding protein